MSARGDASFIYKESSMNSSLDDTTKPRKFSGYHLTMAALGALVIAVALTTIFGSTASNADTTVGKATSKVAKANDVTNPPIVISCEKPVLTLALVLDRSGSVSGNSANPDLYKESVNKFLDDLSGIILTKNGEVNVLLYAFGSRSIVQNDSTAANELITTIDSTSTLQDMKDAVDKIFFAPSAYGNDPSTMNASTSAYDIRRGYNAGVATSGMIPFSYTNWDDALLQVANIGSASYSNPAPGKHIDLTLMLTDGQPNVNNGANRVFEPSDTSSYDSTQGRIYSQDTVKRLRQGAGARPPMAVRGILINSSADAAMNEVFGSGNSNWSSADDFEADLQNVLDDIVDQIENGEPCQSLFVTPSLDINLSPNSVNITEGPGGSKNITVTITNKSKAQDKNGVSKPCPPTACDITNVMFSYPGQPGINLGTILPGQTITRTINVSVPLGGTYASSPRARVEGKFVVSTKVKLAPGVTLTLNPDGTFSVPDTEAYSVGINRVALPS